MIDIITICITSFLSIIVGWNLSRWSKPPPVDPRLWDIRIIHHPEYATKLIVQRFQPRLFRQPGWVRVGPDFVSGAIAAEYKRTLLETDAYLKERNYDDE